MRLESWCVAVSRAAYGYSFLARREKPTSSAIFGSLRALQSCGVCYMASKERKGEPLFAPKPASNPMRDDLEKA